MVDRLVAGGILKSPAVASAMAAVPRHAFVDGAGIAESYAEQAVVVKRDADGSAISSASQPEIVAAMLELGEVQHGHRVLEIGTGTGYNAALLATLVGPSGHVVTVELEEDLATAARRRLRNEGFGQVEVVHADGSAGHPGKAPYDRIVVTAGAGETAASWPDQLVDGGRLIVPIVDAAGVGEIRCLVMSGGRVDVIATMPCGFLPLRSR